MAVIQPLDRETIGLLKTLSQTPTQQLAILITQHAALPRHVMRALQTLAGHAVSQCAPLSGTGKTYAQIVLDVMRRLIQRGDPSQARQLVPSQAALIDLALCVDARDVLARLMGKIDVDDALQTSIQIFSEAKDQGVDAMGRAAFILSRLLHSLPLHDAKHASATQRRLQSAAKTTTAELNTVVASKLLNCMKQYYAKTCDGATDQIKVKICLLDAAWALCTRYLDTHPKATTTDVEKLLSAGHDEGSKNSKPLENLPLLVDLAVIKPFIDLFQHASRHSSTLSALKHRTSAVKASIDHESIDAIWPRILQQISNEDSSGASQSRSDEIDDELLATIFAILPHLQDQQDKLRKKLGQSPYFGQSNEMIVQMLMDEGESSSSPKNGAASVPAAPEDPMDFLRHRANVFDEQPLNASTMTVLHKKGKSRATNERDVMGTGMSSELKSTILGHVDALDADDEEREEWDPFASDVRMEVGFEEELDGDEDEDAEGGARGVNNDRLQRRHEYGSDEEDGGDEDDDDDGQSRQVYERGHGPQNPSSSAKSAASEQAAERILTAHWKRQGKEAFTRGARQSKERAALLTTLNADNVRRWDDQLVESWATMFERNPRREQILASVDDPLRAGNPNRKPTTRQEGDGESSEATSRGFGPDRGRGGRILARTDPDSANNGRGRGRGRGRGGGGRPNQRGRASGNRGRGA